ncbi:hypothetical protein Tco_0737896 [Tanacetum coccineum]
MGAPTQYLCDYWSGWVCLPKFMCGPALILVLQLVGPLGEVKEDLDVIEHDDRACIYGVLVSVDTNDILMKDIFQVLDIWKELILANDTRVRMILTKLRNGNIVFDVRDVWNETLIGDVFFLR